MNDKGLLPEASNIANAHSERHLTRPLRRLTFDFAEVPQKERYARREEGLRRTYMDLTPTTEQAGKKFIAASCEAALESELHIASR